MNEGRIVRGCIKVLVGSVRVKKAFCSLFVENFFSSFERLQIACGGGRGKVSKWV